MIRRPIQSSTYLFLSILSVLVLLGGYTWLSHRQHQVNPEDTTIPTWSQMQTGVVSIFTPNKRSGERWIVEDTKATAGRLFVGMGLGVAGALLLGMLMGCFQPIEAWCAPPLSFLAKIVATGAMAVFFVLVGTELKMYVSIIVFGILPPLALTTHLAVKEFPDELQFKAYTLGASHAEVIWNVIVRYVLPKLIDGVRLMIGPALVYLIAAEMLVADVGFGYRIRLQSKLLDMSVVYPYLTLLAGFGFGMDWLLRLLRRKLCPWFEHHHR